MTTWPTQICPILIYAVLAITLQHTRKRIQRRGWLLTFIITDVFFLCANLAILCILARSGLPQSCRGLCRCPILPQLSADSHSPLPVTFRPGTDQPQEGFTTLGFSDGRKGQSGELDKFCNHERANFFVSLCLVFVPPPPISFTHNPLTPSSFTFQATAVFASVTYYQNKHGYDSKLHDGFDHDGQSLSTLTPSSSTPNPAPSNHRISFANTVAPGSEGILTRNTSIRSTVTTSTFANGGTNPRASLLPAHRGQGITIPRRPIGHSPPPPLPTRSPGGGGGGGHTFVPLPVSEVDSDDDDDDGTIPVADGLRYRPTDPTQHHRPPPPPPVNSQHAQPRSPPLPPSNPPFSFPSHPQASPPSRTPSSASSLTPSVLAHRGLTADGMQRPSSTTLPPYEPPPPTAGGFQTIPLKDDDDAPRQPPTHRRNHSRGKGGSVSHGGGAGSMPLLLEVEEVAGDDAHHALVSDGMRPAGPGLPPYRPPEPRGEEDGKGKGR